MKKTQRDMKEKHDRVDTEQVKRIYQYNQGVGGVGGLDQTISAEI